MDVAGLAAIVTGGASGLGGATARLLAERGATVAIFDVNQALADHHAEEIGGAAFAVDVTDESQVRDAVAAAEAAHGTARILVNCAGIGPPAKVVDRDGNPQPLADFKRIIDINLVGTFNCIAQAGARMQSLDPIGEERGVIVNTASVAAFDGQIGQAAYAASKAGIAGMTLPIAREFARAGVRVMTVAPGLFLTPLLESLPQDALDSLGSQVPFPSRLGRPEEYADLVGAIIANPMLNGETIRLDGAIRMAPR